ncbi:MAG: hypothetical protein KGI10_01095 [Thaumarchaeota archaeon]|nr:hypothetical protein [Nitrososphaerota archaeon]
MKTLYFTIIASVFFMLFLTSHVYATCDIVNGKQTCFGMEPILISIHSDKSHYENSDKPVITITGVPNKLEYLEIDNQSGTVVFSHSIELPSTGVVNYTLDISSYKLGVYSAIASTSNVTAHFMIGLPSGPPIALNVVKNTYAPGDSITILGAEGPDRIIQLSLVDPNGNVVKSVQTNSDNTGQFSSNDLKVPTNAISGIWQVNATHGISYSSIEIKVNSSSTIASTMNSPLKQFKSGIKSHDVKCIRGFELILKTENNSPACVKLDAAYMLIKRGWAASESAYPEGDEQFALKTNSTIIPGHLPRHSGIEIPYQESSRTINYTGFDGVYNVTLMFRGTPQDYVLKPGANGTITFKIEAKASESPGQIYPTPLPKSLNLTNYAVFYHEVTSIKELAKYPGVTISDYEFKTCFTRPGGGGTCIGGEFGGKAPLEAYVVDHPGVNVLFEPPSEVLPLGTNTTSQVVTMMISADNDAPRGTYLVEIPNLGEFLLTVGSQPYHE